MRLIRVELTDWRMFRGGPHAIAFHPRGTVLAGPNETGKSTVFEAVRRTLFDRARTNARWAKGLVPKGVEGATPKVALQFEHNGTTYRIEKSFGKKGTSEFSEYRNGKWIATAKHDDADDVLRTLLGCGTSNDPGGVPPERWGAFQWLFAPQDQRQLPSDPDAADHLGLTEGVTPEFDAVRRLVEKRFLEDFQPARKDFKTGSEIREVERQLTEWQQERDALEERLRRLDEQRRRYDAILEELPTLEEHVEQAKREYDEAQQSAADLTGARERLRAAEAVLKQATFESRQADDVMNERLRLEKELDTARARADDALKLKVQKETLRQQVAVRLKEIEEQKRSLDGLLDGSRKALDDAEVLLKILELRRALQDDTHRLERARELDKRIAEAKASLTGEIPDRDLIRKLEEWTGTASGKRHSLQEFALRVTVEGSPDVTILLDDKPLDGAEGVALDHVAVTTPKGTVRIQGDTRRAQQIAAEAAELERTVAEHLERFDVADVAALRDLREHRQAQWTAIQSLEAERIAVDNRSCGTIEMARAERKAALRELEQRRAGQNAHPEHDTIDESVLKNRVTELEARVAETEDHLVSTRQGLRQLRQDLEASNLQTQKAAEDHAAAEARAKSVREDLDRHVDLHGSTDGCRTRQQGLRTSLDEAHEAAERCRKEYEKLDRTRSDWTATAKQRYDRLNDKLSNQKAAAQQLRQQIEADSSQGLYSSHADVVRRIESETERCGRLKKTATAVKRLKELMDDVRDRALSRIVAPIEQDLADLLSHTTRGRYTLAVVDHTLHPTRLTGNEACEFDEGSQGLRELVSTLVRLSVAGHLAATQRQTLILDDPCIHVSRERTALLVELLNRATAEDRIQVIILTHRDDEFAGLQGEMIELEQVRKLADQPGG